MARTPNIERRSPVARWWQSIPEKTAVAAATAFITGVVTLAGPPLKDWAYSKINHTRGATEQETSVQKAKWIHNKHCAVGLPLWHEADGKQIDATICPDTGDILVVMRDQMGRQFQWWPDLKSLKGQFDDNSSVEPYSVTSLIVGTASAATLPKDGVTEPQHKQLAQMVLCQTFLPDGRGLRRRIIVGPNQCMELIIDSYTGQVFSQRPIPCVPNCLVNV